MIRFVLILVFLAPTVSLAQITKQDSLWLPLKELLGNWNGIGEGQPGKGAYKRSYGVIFNKKYIGKEQVDVSAYRKETERRSS